MTTVWNLIARNQNYRLLLVASLVSTGGDFILTIGMAFYVFSVTRSTLASGTMVLASMLPQFVVGSVAGVFVDRWDRRRTMAVTNVLLAVSLTPMAFVHDEGRIWLIYLTVVVQNSIAPFFGAAEAAILPQLVPADELVSANGLNGQNSQLARLVGSAAGGVLAVAGGIVAVAAVDMASYVVAAGLILLIRSKTGLVRRDPADRSGLAGRIRLVWREWTDGIRVCAGRPDLSTLLVYRTMSWFGEGVLVALLAPFVISVLGATGTQYGAVTAFQAIGGIVGGLAIATLGARASPVLMLGYGALSFGILALLFAVYPLALPQLWPVFVLISIVGLPLAAVNAGYATLQQLRTPEPYRGRVFGATFAVAAISMTLGTVVGGTLGGTVGIIPIISIQGIVHIIAGPFVLARFRRVDRAATSAVASEVLAEKGST